MEPSFFIYNTILFMATFAVGLMTLVKKWEDEPLHLFVSFGAGIFLGVVFLHFVPESLADSAPPSVAAMLLLGFLLIFFVERFFLTRGEGMGLAMINADGEFSGVLFYSILSHNIPAAISLVSLFLLARLAKKAVILMLLIFSISTPGAAVLSHFIFTAQNQTYVAYLNALTAGSLLYVATGELLPEVFHTRAKKWLKLCLLILGIAVTMYIEFA